MSDQSPSPFHPARVGARTRPCPTIDASLTIADARDRMLTAGSHRLVVLDGEEPIGLVSLKELDLAESTGSPAETELREVCREPFRCDPSARAQQAISQMAAKGHTCALVVHDGEVLGVFTPSERRLKFARGPAPTRTSVKRVTRLRDVLLSHGAMPTGTIGKL